MPPQELKEWIAITKDILLSIGAIVTMALGLYGLRVWKRDLVGKEVYSAAKTLVKESHLISNASRKLREPILTYERKSFCDEEIRNTTENERWRISEADAYIEKINNFAEELKRYEAAKLELRVLVGSKIYEGFLPFGAALTESINRVNAYLDIIRDYSKSIFPDSEEVLKAQSALYPSSNLNDELSQRIADLREAGEISLLSCLHRKSIRG